MLLPLVLISWTAVLEVFVAIDSQGLGIGVGGGWQAEQILLGGGGLNVYWWRVGGGGGGSSEAVSFLVC